MSFKDSFNLGHYIANQEKLNLTWVVFFFFPTRYGSIETVRAFLMTDGYSGPQQSRVPPDTQLGCVDCAFPAVVFFLRSCWWISREHHGKASDSFKAVRLKKLAGGYSFQLGTLPGGFVVSFVGVPYGGLPLGRGGLCAPSAEGPGPPSFNKPLRSAPAAAVVVALADAHFDGNWQGVKLWP